MAVEFSRLSRILEWIGSHPSRLDRPDFKVQRHLPNGRVICIQNGARKSIKLDADGIPTAQLMVDSGPLRIEIYGGSNELLFTEETVA